MSNDDRDKIREHQQLEQQIAEVADFLPRLWRALYLKLLEQEFTEDQAIKLLIAHIQKP